MMNYYDYNDDDDDDDDVESVDLLQPSDNTTAATATAETTNTTIYPTNKSNDTVRIPTTAVLTMAHHHSNSIVNHHHRASSSSNIPTVYHDDYASLSQEQYSQHQERWNQTKSSMFTNTAAAAAAASSTTTYPVASSSSTSQTASRLAATSHDTRHNNTIGDQQRRHGSGGGSPMTTTTTTTSMTPPPPSSSSMLMYSPATQTLNALQQSQGMVDLLLGNNNSNNDNYDDDDDDDDNGDDNINHHPNTNTTSTMTTALSQLEYDVVNALVRTKQVSVDTNDCDDRNIDDDDDEEKYAATTATMIGDNVSSSNTASWLPSEHQSHYNSSKRPNHKRPNHKRQKTVQSSSSSLLSSVAAIPEEQTSKRTTSTTSTVKNRNHNRPLPVPSSSTATAKAVSTSATTTKKRGRMADSERRDIIQINIQTGQRVDRTFTSFSEAGQYNNFSRHIVSQILRGTYKSNQYKGYTFRYVDANDDTNNNDNNNNSDDEKHSNNDTATITTGTGAISSTANNIKRKSMKQVLESVDDKDNNNSDDGNSDDNDGPTIPKKTMKPKPKPPQKLPRARPIIAIKGGTTIRQTFPSMLSASKKTLVPRKQIAQIVRGELDMFNCWTFQSNDNDDNDNDIKDNNKNNDNNNSSSDDDEGDEMVRRQSLLEAKTHASPVAPKKCITVSTTTSTLDNMTTVSVVPKRKKPPSVSVPVAVAATSSTHDLQQSQSTTDATSVATSTSAGGRHSKQAISVEEYDAHTGQLLRTYRSLTLAAEMSGTNRHIITSVLRGKNSHWNGLKWQYSTTTATNSSESSSSIMDDNTVAPTERIIPEPSDKQQYDEYVVQDIVITTHGRLGISIKKVKAPEVVLSLLNMIVTDEINALRVDSFVDDETSLAQICGIQVGDYLFAPEKEEEKQQQQQPLDGTTLDNYDRVVELLMGQLRPITLNAVRLKSSSTLTGTRDATDPSTKNDQPDNNRNNKNNNTTKGSSQSHGQRNGTNSSNNPSQNDNPGTDGEHGNDIDTNYLTITLPTGRPSDLCTSGRQTTTKHRNNQHSSWEIQVNDKPSATRKVAPYCALCNGLKTTRPIHHAWCPKNEHYTTSGADEVVEKIRRGMNINCGGCNKEYKSGCRVPKREHLMSCIGDSNGMSLSVVDRKVYQSKRNSKHAKSCVPRKMDILNDNKKLDKSSAPMKMNILKGNTQQLAKMGKAERKEKPKLSKATVKVAKSVDFQGNAVNSVKTVSTNNPVKSSGLSDEDSIDDFDNGEKLNITWDDCDNVWGSEGHLENVDVVIYSTSNIRCHYETLLSDERYEVDPFMSCRQYHKTHSTPEQGYQAIVLRRDVFARRPWGFTCCRHEFGGACLVSSVEPLSPADAGKLLGSGVDGKAPLRVNDMIIAVNGEIVGGMTTTGVEIELDLSGPEVTLLVARYKFPIETQERVAQLEQSYVGVLDSAMNDDRQVGWVDFGAVIPPVRASGTMSHFIRPSPINADSDGTDLSVSDSAETIDDEPVRRMQDTKQNLPGNTHHVSPFPVVHSGLDGKLGAAFIPIREGKISTSPDAKKRLENKRTKCDDENDWNNQSQSATDSKEDECSDDGNAWCGCVCGQTHKRKTNKHPDIFWIQCDVCSTWYDCSSACIGFTRDDAPIKVPWICWGCPLPESNTIPVTDMAAMLSKTSGRVSLSPVAMEILPTQQKPHRFESGSSIPIIETSKQQQSKDSMDMSAPQKSDCESDSTNPIHKTNQRKDNDTEETYAVNDLVYVEEHGWAGVNNSEGIAKVLKCYFNDDGDHVYDIRYVVGGTTKGVLPEYLTRHFFNIN